MSDFLLITILICACAGVISELITIALPEKIVKITEKEPDKLLKEKFYRLILILSFPYMLAIILLLFSGNERFRIYAVIILTISLFGWIFKTKLKHHLYIIMIESGICLILLIDVVRNIMREFGLLQL